MPTIPAAILRQLYQRGSLRNVADGWEFTMRNHLASAHLTGLGLTCDGAVIGAERIRVRQAGGPGDVPAAALGSAAPLLFAVQVPTVVHVAGAGLAPGLHGLAIAAETREIGTVTIAVQDTVAADPAG